MEAIQGYLKAMLSFRLTNCRYRFGVRYRHGTVPLLGLSHLIFWSSVVSILAACVPATVRVDTEKIESASIAEIGVVLGYEFGSVHNMNLSGPITSRVTNAVEESAKDLALKTVSDQLIAKGYKVEIAQSGYLPWHMVKHGDGQQVTLDIDASEAGQVDAHLLVQVRVSPRLFGIGDPSGGLFYERDIRKVTLETFWPKVGFSEVRLVSSDTGDVLFFREKSVAYQEHRKDPIQEAYAELLDLSDIPKSAIRGQARNLRK